MPWQNELRLNVAWTKVPGPVEQREKLTTLHWHCEQESEPMTCGKKNGHKNVQDAVAHCWG